MTVGIVNEPLEIGISGTNEIQSSGWHSWSASASGGVTPYAYQWEYCLGGCTVVGSGSSYSRYVEVGDDDFTLKLTVTDSGSGGLQQQESVWHSVYVHKDGGVFVQPMDGDTIG